MQKNVEIYQENSTLLLVGVLFMLVGLMILPQQCIQVFKQTNFEAASGYLVAIIVGLIAVIVGICALLKIETKPVLICCKHGLIIRKKKKEIAIKWQEILETKVVVLRDDNKRNSYFCVMTSSGENYKIPYIHSDEVLKIINEYREGIINIYEEPSDNNSALSLRISLLMYTPETITQTDYSDKFCR